MLHYCQDCDRVMNDDSVLSHNGGRKHRAAVRMNEARGASCLGCGIVSFSSLAQLREHGDTKKHRRFSILWELGVVAYNARRDAFLGYYCLECDYFSDVDQVTHELALGGRHQRGLANRAQ
jgi:hypothetical protein